MSICGVVELYFGSVYQLHIVVGLFKQMLVYFIMLTLAFGKYS